MLQFHLTNFFGTRFKTHGVAIPKEEGLQLVFREGEDPPKLFDEDIRSVLIEWPNFQGLEVKRGLLGTSVALTVRSARQLADVPGLEDNTLLLKIHRKHVEQIEDFERSLNSYRSGRVDEDVDDFIDDVRDFLHGS